MHRKQSKFLVSQPNVDSRVCKSSIPVLKKKKKRKNGEGDGKINVPNHNHKHNVASRPKWFSAEVQLLNYTCGKKRYILWKVNTHSMILTMV